MTIKTSVTKITGNGNLKLWRITEIYKTKRILIENINAPTTL
jgi:hypothetical protein